MNFLLAALLFIAAWLFAEQGLYFFSMLFIIALVMAAVASGNKPTRVSMTMNAPAAQQSQPPAAPNWDDDRIERFGRNLAKVVLFPLELIWKVMKFLWGNKK